MNQFARENIVNGQAQTGSGSSALQRRSYLSMTDGDLPTPINIWHLDGLTAEGDPDSLSVAGGSQNIDLNPNVLGQRWTLFNGSSDWLQYNGANNSNYQLKNATTIVCLVQPTSAQDGVIAQCSNKNSGDTEPDNTLWALGLDEQSGSLYPYFFWEDGSGNNQEWKSSESIPLNTPAVLIGVRDSAGTGIKLYYNATELSGSWTQGSGVLATGGGNSHIMISQGGGVNLWNYYRGYCACLAVYGAEFTTAQIEHATLTLMG